MKLGVALTLLGLGACAVTLATVQGCSDSNSSDGGTTGDQTGRIAPAEEGTPTSSTDERLFALHTLSLGDADRAGNKNSNAWKSFGYNLDGLVTNVTDKNSPDLGKVCKPPAGSRATVHQDGEQGTDNSFGKEIVALLGSVVPEASSKNVSDSIQRGDFTIMMKIVGLTDDAAQTNTGLNGTVLIGAQFSSDPATRPTFSTTESWPFIKDPQVPIAGSYINKGVFVNGKGGADIALKLNIGGQSLDLTIRKALITFKHNPATKSLEDGTIAGIVSTQEFVDGVGKIATSIAPSFCEGSTLDGMKNNLRQASDMLIDGTQDPSKECNGISVGLGFTAKQIGKQGEAVTPTNTATDLCAKDGGT